MPRDDKPDQLDLGDLLNECKAKVAFLTDVFSQDDVRTFSFSEQGMFGFYLILSDIETMIDHVGNELKLSNAG